MKILNYKLLCTAALLAALPLAGCTNMNKGNETTDNGYQISQQSRIVDGEENSEGNENDCPECPDGESDKDECPDCPDGEKPECPKKRKHKKRMGKKHVELPRGDIRKHRKRPVPPKKPVKPPKDDDVILPDPPVEGELPNN